MCQARALCPKNVASFYQNLLISYFENHYELNQIWNVDESGVQTCKTEQCKVLARKGIRVVHTLVLDE